MRRLNIGIVAKGSFKDVALIKGGVTHKDKNI